MSGEPSSDAWDVVFKEASQSAAKISRMIADLGAIGGKPNGEVSRLAFTASEREAHDLVGGWLAAAKFDVRVDAFGNTIADRPGSEDGLRPIAFGSHADSVPVGGRFDGAAGVVISAHLAQLLAAHDVPSRHPLRVVVFANEEGARFGEPCLGSKALVGRIGQGDAERLVDANGVHLSAAMRALGFDPTRLEECVWKDDEIELFVEPHIEQGRVLEERGKAIGVVDIVAGSSRLRVDLHGRSDHSGGTPMSLRRDALAGAAEVVSLVERVGNRNPVGTVATVGRLEARPNNITTVSGFVTMYVDLRDTDALRRIESVELAVAGVDEIARRRRLESNVTVIAHTPPIHLWAWARDLVKRAARDAGADWRTMPSGAGHDAQILAGRYPTAMIFVPSRDGASHVPSEWTEPGELATGLEVLARTVALADEVG